MDRSMELKFQSFAPMISNTPLLEIQYKYRGNDRRIFAKAEYYNLSGSIKDRVAFHILKKAYESHAIQKGDCIAEATSGNTGIAFSAMGSYLGHKVVIYMPDWMSRERISLMESYGAKVRLVSKEEGWRSKEMCFSPGNSPMRTMWKPTILLLVRKSCVSSPPWA